MSSQTKRSLLKLGGLAAVAASAALIGCGKKEEPAQQAAAPASAPASAAAPAKPEPLKIAFAYVGPVGDGGWTSFGTSSRHSAERPTGNRTVPGPEFHPEGGMGLRGRPTAFRRP